MSGVAGLLCTVLLVAVAELTASLLRGARSPFEALGHAIIDMTPGPLIDFGVALLQEQDKLVIRLSLGMLLAAAGVAAGQAAFFDPAYGYAILFITVFLLLTASVTRAETRVLPMTVACLAGGLASLLTFRWLHFNSGVWPLLIVFLFTSLFVLMASALKLQRRAVYAAARTGFPSLGPVHESEEVNLPLSRIGKHYVIDVKLSKPLIDPASWRLQIIGLVKDELCLSYQDLLTLPSIEQAVTLRCVHDPPGGPRADTALWRGVKVSDLLAKAGLVSQAVSVVARSVDGYKARVPLSVLESNRAFIALGMNGEKLTHEHGFPARLITPGVYGFDANTKWLTELEVVADHVKDWGEKRGWPAEPRFVQPCARIDVPAHLSEVLAGDVTVTGVAWSHGDGVAAVEVRVDGGAWRLAELGAEANQHAWRQWQFTWHAAEGNHTLEARVIGRERQQVEAPSGTFPDGPTGLHKIRVSALPSPSAEGSVARKLRRLFSEADDRVRLALLWLKAWF